MMSRYRYNFTFTDCEIEVRSYGDKPKEINISLDSDTPGYVTLAPNEAVGLAYVLLGAIVASMESEES